MKEEDKFSMYGEYANIVGVVAGEHNGQACSDLNDESGLDFDFGLAHLEEANHLEHATAQISERETVSDIMQHHTQDPLILVLGQPPFYVEYVSTSWVDQFGWSLEEIRGLDLKFLQGDGAIGINIRTLYDVAYTEKKKMIDISGYHRDGTLFTCTLICTPIYDIERAHNTRFLSNMSLKFTNFRKFDFPPSIDTFESLNEIGMPLDRREYSTSYKYPGAINPVYKTSGYAEFLRASRNIAQLPLSDIVRFLSTSSTSIAVALSDKQGRIISINDSFAHMFGVKMKEIEGKSFEFLFNKLTDEQSRDHFPSERFNGLLTEEDKYSEEFTAVLYDKKLREITCRIDIQPTAFSALNEHKPNAVYFGVCIQNLHLEDMCMPRPILTDFGRYRREKESGSNSSPPSVPIIPPFLSPSKFPIRLPLTFDTPLPEHQLSQ